MRSIYIVFSILILFSNCGTDNDKKQFRLLKSSKTGITFSNILTENDSINGLIFEYIYNGAGVGIGDFNNDGLQDIFFAGNMVSSELYLNQGNLAFKKVSEKAGIKTDSWCTGVSVIDINSDGFKDIYISVAGFDTITYTRKNIFFINQGLDEEGIPHFLNEAEQMGLDDDGYSTMGVFFDYDKDDDLDLYSLTNSMEGVLRSMIRVIRKDGTGKSTDRLYRNDGNNHFTNVSKEAGIVNEGYGLGVGLVDINQDGWPDVYCSNDFISNDLLYINNQDGTFKEKSSEYFKHFTHNGMGMDIADINNDALSDVMVLDMLPMDNKRQKLMLASNSITFKESIAAGYHPQFLRNTLQLNRGKFQDGKYRFSEIGFYTGFYETDWSWAPLFADFDNDGWKDLLVTNGFRKDVTNLDYIEKIVEISRFGTKKANKQLIGKALEELPDVKLPNHIFKNNGGLTFEDKSVEWGIIHETFTNGTALADFDNDGDLDMILNNLDMEASFYENKLIDNGQKSIDNYYLNIRFDPSVKDKDKLGLKVWLYQRKNNQYEEFYPFRGYKSTMEDEIHFGLENEKNIDSIVFQWSDGIVNKVERLIADTVLILTRNLTHLANQEIPESFIKNNYDFHFTDITKDLQLDFKHSSITNTDFNVTPTLLRSLSHFGPSISVGDMNNDGLEDLFIGGDTRIPAYLFFQNENSTFSMNKLMQDSIFHDTGSLLFDADSDGDLDLYVVSGGYRWTSDRGYYQDRLYLNDGLGNYTISPESLPKINSSGSCVIAGDYDKDGDLDLFIGGRVEGRKYPLAPQSLLLQNENGKFSDRSDLLGETAGKLGMVTSAIWTDVNNDSNLDIIVVGEWMPVTILINNNERFNNQSTDFNLNNTTGWWNSINGADFDNDGDTDYILGNYGLNSFYKASVEKPLEIYAKDFDLNGTLDPVITHYSKGEPYIVHPLLIMKDLIPGMRNRFRTHSEFGDATFHNSFTEQELDGAYHLNAKTLSSIVLENLDSNSFKIHELPENVQFSPVFGSLIQDLNGDGLKDIILVGNSTKEETITGYYDASYGNVLINKGGFIFESIEPAHSNFVADGDKKALARMIVDGQPVYLLSENDGYLQAYAVTHPGDLTRIKFQQNDWYFTYEMNGIKIKQELYHGSGFLSSSSRFTQIPKCIQEIEVYKYNGESRSQFFE